MYAIKKEYRFFYSTCSNLCYRLTFLYSLLIGVFSCFFVGCRYSSASAEESIFLSFAHTVTHTSGQASSIPPLVLTFAGDLMAHTVNYNMKNYNAIYTDVISILQSDDISFVNVETPICDSLPLASYPAFNVHTPYLHAAVKAGFDVLSFANNHTNDYGVTGIEGTLAAVRAIQKEYCTDNSPCRFPAFSGLKNEYSEQLQFTPLWYKGWSILFISVTELLNSYDASKERLYYSAPTKEGRAILLSVINHARKQYPCDICILALHLNEREYGRTVSKEKKQWFKQLGEAGVDIIWAHHPHVMQPWEIITVDRPISLNAVGTAESAGASKTVQTVQTHDNMLERNNVLCMYSMGNFISGQRWHTHYDDPAFYREYTGDAVLLQVTCTRNCAGKADFSILPIPITQYNETKHPVVKRFTQDWIQSLNKKERMYFTRRFELMKDYLPF